ncbi:tRNA glutamyl-Q(34) synthetase GluQRS [Leucobacter luti]|uniref:Glutamyl-Q tRNA(Asp) synthetase n=1 Tax=Leucobacter luti TaxID=340320 RepID=A0A4Q7TKB1_9MICO|nr:tRNA glutamyl-Q(34) synthetase GluQRS [Leucobacter luti]MBL3700221.1 tRNA glutamyl-Q(34) synthetase GluQRS [Leucobacter luti]RZT61056.1 glutamyl-tRNA synthetase [Leucobacter luti]
MPQHEAGAGRYAPSPSGDLHLGNLRTALLAWLFARSSGRRFLMRIEDLDRARDAGSGEHQLTDLTLLGIDWDGDAVLQSDRAADHEAAIARLADAGLVYECTCTRRDILAAPSAPHAPPGAYPGTCRDRSDAEREEARRAIAPRLPALRLRVPEGSGEREFTDLVLGRARGEIDDFVLRRGDGTVAYNLAVVVDDAAMRVDQVVRGDDLASSTPRQILLQRLLGLPSPPAVEYAHVPLVLGPGGARLAKRDGAVTLSDLAADGIDAEAARAILARSLGLAAPGELVTLTQMLDRFDPALLPREPWTWPPASVGAYPRRA